MKKTILPALVALCLMLTGCQAPDTGLAPLEATQTPLPVYAIVVKDANNPYMQRMYEGFADGCARLGVQARLTGPGDDITQAEIVEELITDGVCAIAIAANDPDEVSPALKKAIAAGIPVVSLDSMVYPGDRMVHIQQASPEMIGRVLVQAGAQMIGDAGEIAILTTTPTMPNQANWVRWMEYELLHSPERYANIRLTEIVYGQDEHAPSAAKTRELLANYPSLKLIIAPTVMGLRAAAEEITAQGSSVKVTGLGLPSAMEPHITSGVCPWMYLWNPSEVGMLAAYAAEALVGGRLTGAVGEILSAGPLGDKAVTAGEDGGSEVVLGNPKMFDQTNIMMWKEVF